MSAWRVILTDSESLTGVAPVCSEQRNPEGPHCVTDWRVDLDGVFDCCPHPHIECWSETMAARIAELLTQTEAEICS
ncbi:MAG: hypothetical protein ACJ72N_27525 [Labedaea sp.]